MSDATDSEITTPAETPELEWDNNAADEREVLP